jgi:hypothetical protein
MIRPRFPVRLVLPLGAMACLGHSGCSGLITSIGGGPTQELREHGVSAQAEIVEIWDTGWTINDNPVIGMKVLVQPGDRPAYEATIEKTTVSRIAIPQFQPGNVIPVRFDPQNPSIVAVDREGGSPPPPTPSSGNPYRDSFERATIEGPVLLPPPPEPRLYLGTADLTTDFQTLFEHDYVLLGGSGARNAGNPQLALDQGREIGAALVVVYGHFAPPPGLALDVLPFQRRSALPGQSAGSAPAYAPASRFVTGRLEPDGQFATYWGKTRPPILGIVSRPLDAQEQARLNRQNGIVVETVSIGSPAAAAGIAIGDILVAIDGQPLPDARAVPELLTSLAGREVRIDLIRDGSSSTVAVRLNPTTP